MDLQEFERCVPDVKRMLWAIGYPSRPAYIVAPTISEQFAGGLNCTAFVSPILDVQLQPKLEDRGAWQGRGFTTVVDHENIVNLPHLMAIVLHEFGHNPMTRLYEEATAEYERTAQLVRGTETSPAPDVAPSKQPVPWFGHGADWIRFTLHCWHRAHSRGFYVPFEYMTVAGRLYGLSPAKEYAKAMGDEFLNAERRQIPLIDIYQDNKLPAALTDLFERDKAAWHAKQQGAAND